ncbi:polar amino acid ABC transporter permease [Paraburkholderia sp.]|uniref:polar amino acid ABC transporter permease n=1 Tax=Paraburkholderia sp. TaxID=1926495 RepID=UPI003D6DE882
MNGLEHTASVGDIVSLLFAWTPFLAGGFMWNIAISVIAMIVGTVCGYLLMRLSASSRRACANTGITVTGLTRNIPTFVFQFYLVFMLPDTLPLPFAAARMPFPSWLKAALALALAVSAFVSDHLLRAVRAWRAGCRRDAHLFVSSWGNYFVIVVMASSTASVIGVPEIVSRCNTVVNAAGRTDMMLWVYLYAMAWFFAFCYCATLLIRRLSHSLDRRLSEDA